MIMSTSIATTRWIEDEDEVEVKVEIEVEVEIGVEVDLVVEEGQEKGQGHSRRADGAGRQRIQAAGLQRTTATTTMRRRGNTKNGHGHGDGHRLATTIGEIADVITVIDRKIGGQHGGGGGQLLHETTGENEAGDDDDGDTLLAAATRRFRFEKRRLSMTTELPRFASTRSGMARKKSAEVDVGMVMAVVRIVTTSPLMGSVDTVMTATTKGTWKDKGGGQNGT